MRALVAGLFAVLVCVARGDTPLPPQSKVTATSPSGRIRAISDPNSGTRVEDVKQAKILWRLPDWHRRLFVADDGDHLVTEYDGLDLIPVDFTDDLVLFTFWRKGRKIQEITARDLLPDRSILRPTMGLHYVWRREDGIDAQGRFRVQRVDGKIFLFDITTGAKIET